MKPTQVCREAAERMSKEYAARAKRRRAARRAAVDREMWGPDYDEPQELESISNCDDYGTGEGRYHGRM